jgi:pimeloyl-ACP methyl ester carboxylesterase
MHDLAQDAVDVLDHLELTDTWIGGHAFGGAVARTVALDHPGRIDGVLLLGVEGAEPVSNEAAHALEAAFTATSEAEGLDAIRLLAGDSVDPTFAWNVFSRARDTSVEEMQRSALAATSTQEWAPLAPRIPVLIMQGSDDRVAVPANGEKLQASAPERASIARVEGGGHLFVLTHPGEIGAEIEDYLGWD